MAQQAIAKKKETSPAVHVGTPNNEIKERFASLARRAFSIFESNGRRLGNELADWLRAEKELFCPARLELTESGEGFTVRAEVPGFTPKDLEINVEGRRVTISGKREKHEEHKDKKTVYSETCSDQVFRVVDLPADVSAEDTKATLKDGILELEIPKAAPVKKVLVTPETK
jgi:HSP20 family protein